MPGGGAWVVTFALGEAAAGEARDVTPWGFMALLAGLLGVHGVFALTRRIRAWRKEGGGIPRGAVLAAAFRLAVTWAMAAAMASVLAIPALESDGAGAAGALMMILGGLGFGSYALALGLVTPLAASRLLLNEAGAPCARPAALTSLGVTATWLLLCPSPILLTGEAHPSPWSLAGLVMGALVYSGILVAAVFWRVRGPLPADEATLES